MLRWSGGTKVPTGCAARVCHHPGSQCHRRCRPCSQPFQRSPSSAAVLPVSRSLVLVICWPAALPAPGWAGRRGGLKPLSCFIRSIYTQTCHPCISPTFNQPSTRWDSHLHHNGLGATTQGWDHSSGHLLGGAASPPHSRPWGDLGAPLFLTGSTPLSSLFLSCGLCGLFSHRALGSFPQCRRRTSSISGSAGLSPPHLLTVLGALWRTGLRGQPRMSPGPQAC